MSAYSILEPRAVTEQTEVSLWEQTKTAIKLRLPVLLGLLAGLSLFLLMLLNPFQSYWTFVFEGLRLYQWWPVLFLLCSILFPLAGHFEHKRSGLALFFPAISLLAAMGFTLLVFVLLTEWAADRSVSWCVAALVILAAASVTIALGLICYAEVWRNTSNRQVIKRVRDSLETKEFENYLKRRWLWNPKRWGSPHCLQVVEGHYQQQKYHLLQSLRKQPELINKLLDNCLRAGNTLLAYLQLRIATMPREAQDWHVAELSREMATMYLWAAATSSESQDVSYGEIDKRMERLRQALGDSYTPYAEFLEYVFKLAENSPRSEREINNVVREVMVRFERVTLVPTTAPGNLLDICSSTWLAVSPTCDRFVNSTDLWNQVVMDVWIHMRRIQEAGLIVPTDSNKQIDVANAWAREQLVALYENWRARTPEEWDQALEGRALEARQAADRSNGARRVDPWITVEGQTENTSSWPYLFVWKTPRVLKQAIALAGCLLLFGVIVLTAVNPEMPGNPGWNTIDRITDLRPLHDYASADIHAMAASEDLLAVASSEGVTFISKATRVPTPVITDVPARDITRGPEPDSFIMLGEDGRITNLSSSPWQDHKVWLPKADVPFWPGAGEAGTVIANHLDRSGWLVCMKEKGIARYRFGEHNGKTHRWRSWQLGDLSESPLLEARFTKSGVWAMLSGGGIRYAALDTLQEDKKRRLESEEIRHFDADYRGTHAAAIDASDRLWLYPPGERGWAGPFFGQDTFKLRAASDVNVARLAGDTAWLGADYGLFAYDVNRRRIRPVIQDSGIDRIVVGEPTSTVLAAGSRGLYAVGRKEDSYASSTLDIGQVSSLSLSPDGKLCLYRLRTESTGGQFEVRRIVYPFDRGPELLVGAQGWKATGAPPTILGIKPLGAGALFITSQGSFLYDRAKHQYEDCSKSLFAAGPQGRSAEEEKTLSFFSYVDPGQQRILCIADNNPHLFVPNEKRWRSLDPNRETQPRQIIDSTGGIFAVGDKGQLHNYNEASLSPASFLAGESPSLKRQPPANNRIAGDLLPLDGAGMRWKLAMLQGSSIIRYESHNGLMEEKPLPFADTVQVRWGQTDLLYLRRNGAVAAAERGEIFGSGVLPFAPNQATAFTQGDHGSSIIVSGPGRQLFKYRWGNASWVRVGPSPIPGGSEVTQLAQTQSGVLTQLSDGMLFFTSGRSWLGLPGYQRWAASSNQYTFWGLKPDGLVRISPREDRPANQWEEARAATGHGMRRFVEASTYVWKKDEYNLVFFTGGNRVGIYNFFDDTWHEGQLGELQKPSQFAAAAGCVAILDGNRLLRVNKDMKVQQINQFPPQAKSINLRANGDSLLVAFITDKGKITLRVWGKACEGSSVEHSRGGGGAPVDFNPAQIVYAGPDKRLGSGGASKNVPILLIDINGGCVVYDWRKGTWQTRRKAFAGQTVYGWIPPTDKTPIMLYLKTRDQNLVMASDASNMAGTPVSEEPTSITRPEDGELVDEDEINIVRENGQTTYRVYRGKEWQTLNPQQGGFAEDFAQDIAISSSGQLWALQGDRLRLIEVGEDRVLNLSSQAVVLNRSAATINEISSEPQVAALGITQPGVAETLASIAYLDLRLVWEKRPDGSMNAYWQNADYSSPNIPVYCGDRFAGQCIQDIAMSPDNMLLLSTEIGLVVRNPATFELKAVYPQLRGTRFIRTDGGTRLMLMIDGQIVYEYKEGAPASFMLSAHRLVDQLESGPWVWQRSASGAVAVVFKSTGRYRSWSRVDGGWKFDDDIVKWILRGDRLVLQTNNGLWPFDETAGRQEPELPYSEKPGDEYSVATPAIRIVCSAGVISLHPFDGNDRPAFEQGRFFFDNSEQLCASGEYLYTLVPHRGLFRRSTQAPGIISGAWSLTPESALGGEYILESVADVVRIKSGAAGAQAKVAFQLEPGQQGDAWRRVELGSSRLEINLGAATWQFEEGRSRLFEPFLAVGSHNKLDHWWSEDRFAWDKIKAIEALDENRAIFVTAAGPMFVRFTANGYEPICLWLKNDAAHCAVARERGQRVGVVIWGETEFPQYLFTGEGDHCSLTTRDSGASLVWEPKLQVQFEQSADYGRYISIGEQWQHPGPQGALTSGLGNLLSTEELIANGQFVYDCATAASPLTVGDKATNEWVVSSTSRRDGSLSNRISRFTYHQGDAGRPSLLLLRGFWPAPCRFESLRLSERGEVLGLERTATRAWQAFKLSLHSGSPVWTSLRLEETGEHFRSGDKVLIDLKTLDWRRQDSAYLWTEKVLDTTSAGYKLFSNTPKGSMLSFDRMNTLSLNAAGKSIAVGTDGGVFLWPYDKGGLGLLALGQTEGRFTFNQSAKPDNWTLNVERLRRDGDDRLWAKFGAKGTVAELTKEGKWNLSQKNDWAMRMGRFGSYRVNLDGVGFEIGSKKFLESNDAWSINRGPLSNIIDFSFDADTQYMWVATRNHGIYKIVTRRLK